MPEASLKDYYHKLYDFQDNLLKLIDGLNPGFYLGGGTALGRFYFGHRYSDDLDFFSGGDADFVDLLGQVSEHLREEEFRFDTFGMSPEFARFHIHDKTNTLETPLKVDFINEKDAPHFGEFRSTEGFSKVDNPRNILSNKLSFIYKKAPKDIADIWFICRNLSFRWEEVIWEAAQKRALEPLFVVDCLMQFPASDLGKVPWSKTICIEDFERDRQVMIDNIITKSDNALSG